MNSPPWMHAANWSMRKSNVLRTRRLTSRSNSPRNWSAMKAGTMVCIGTVPAMSSRARSTLSSLMHAKSYIVDGKMSAGFALVAYPVEYRSSGVMTFIVDASGTIYEKDLGPNTTKLAQAMTVYDPDYTWHKVE